MSEVSVPTSSQHVWWRWAALLAFTALACGVLLSGLSIWFLGSVALAGLSGAAYTFNFHLPAALVRLFAVGRTAAKYGERLTGHKAALLDQIGRRVTLFRTMADAPAVRAAGWQLGDEARLADYLDDVEDIDFAGLRADLPLTTLSITFAILIIATFMIVPLATGPIVVMTLLLLICGYQLALVAAEKLAAVRAERRNGAQRLGAALASVVPLQAERMWQALTLDAVDRFTRADRLTRAIQRSQSNTDAVTAAFGPLAAVSIIGAAWLAGAQSQNLLAPAFLAFAWFAFGEALQSGSRIVTALMRRRAAVKEMTSPQKAPQILCAKEQLCLPPAALPTLGLLGLQRLAPNGRLIGSPINARLKPSQPTVLMGPSGCGKTSLLKQIAGWIGEDTMNFGSRRLAAEARRELSFFCPHDSAIIADTVRANLFAPLASDDAMLDALKAVELDGRIEAAGGLNGWITQDMLSLGEAQRLNLARAWLSDRPVMLLDEPIEHLDDEQGGRILARLLDHLCDRIVVFSSHKLVPLKNITLINLSTRSLL